jgi:LacI family transcriptional regulator
LSGSRKSTIQDVAEMAGVSTSTVSHVINDTRFVSEEIRVRVRESIEKLKYNANPAARSLRSGTSNLVGFIVSNISNYFYTRIAKGIDQVLSKVGYHIILIDSAEDKKIEKENVKSLYLRGVDGLIIAPTTNDCSYLAEIVRKNFPIVLVDRKPADFEADSIMLHNIEGSYKATQYLIGKGHRDIGFLAFNYDGEDGTMQERVRGYRKALLEAGLQPNEDYIILAEGGTATFHELRNAESYRMMEKLLETPATAVICGNDLASIGAFSCLKDKGIPIPGRMAFITFDDSFWLTMSTPRVSVVAQPAEQIGSVAAQRLLERIQGRAMLHECLRLGAEFILRDSC